MVEQALPQPHVPAFSFVGMLGGTFTTFGRGFVPFMIGLVAISAVQFTVIFWVVERMLVQVQSIPPWASWALVLTNTVGDALTWSYLSGLALSILEDNRADWRRALARIPTVFLPIAVLTATYAMLARFGIPGLPRLVLVVVPLVIGTLTWVYVSTLVREGGNPLSALRRNLRLTRGHRWKIVGLLAMMIVVYFILAFGGGFVVGVVYGVLKVPVTMEASVGVELVTTQVLNVFSYIAAAVSYHLLRHEKDDHSAVAQVFD